MNLNAKELMQSGVYILRNGGVVIYVGQSGNMLQRIGVHAGNFDFDNVETIPAPVDELNDLEARLIMLYKPENNTTLPRNSIYFFFCEIRDMFGITKHQLRKTQQKGVKLDFLGRLIYMEKSQLTALKQALNVNIIPLNDF
jgi:excinuclease UvrABC nuclease subunit